MATLVNGSKLLFVTPLALLACSTDGGAPEPPPPDGKGDFASSVDQRGPIEFGGEARGEFSKDLEFHAYTFDTKADAVVDLDITQLGSARALDSTMFVFGPRAGDGAGPLLASDDESGHGQKSRLLDLALGAAGTYTVVLGTDGNLGRGHYRLTLECASGDCAAEPVVDDKDPDELMDCVMTAADALFGEIPFFDDNMHEDVISELASNAFFENIPSRCDELSLCDDVMDEALFPDVEFLDDPEMCSLLIDNAAAGMFELGRQDGTSAEECVSYVIDCADDCVAQWTDASLSTTEAFDLCWRNLEATCLTITPEMDVCGGPVAVGSKEECVMRCQAIGGLMGGDPLCEGDGGVVTECDGL